MRRSELPEFVVLQVNHDAGTFYRIAMTNLVQLDALPLYTLLSNPHPLLNGGTQRTEYSRKRDALLACQTLQDDIETFRSSPDLEALFTTISSDL